MPKLAFDLRLIEIEYELWALGHLRAILEQQIVTLREQDEEKTFAELRKSGWDHHEGDWQLASTEFSERQDYVIPRFMRGPFTVSLWACYESGVREVADFLSRRLSAPLRLADLRGESELAQFKKYFAKILGHPLDTSPDRLAFIEDLRRIRNALAHANGQRRAMTEEQWNRVADALRRRACPPDDYRGFIVLSERFAADAFEVVNSSLRELVARARAA